MDVLKLEWLERIAVALERIAARLECVLGRGVVIQPSGSPVFVPPSGATYEVTC